MAATALNSRRVHTFLKKNPAFHHTQSLSSFSFSSSVSLPQDREIAIAIAESSNDKQETKFKSKLSCILQVSNSYRLQQHLWWNLLANSRMKVKLSKEPGRKTAKVDIGTGTMWPY